MNGDVSEDELLAAFTEQAEALADGGPDGLVIETMQDLEPRRSSPIAAARTTGLPVVASMVFDSGKDKDRTMMGTTPEQAAAGLVAAGADVIGANCGQGIAGFVTICARLKAAAGGRPVWIKANAGLPADARRTKRSMRRRRRSSRATSPPCCAAGASFIGGCCGTAPEFIREIRRVLRRS